MHYSKFIAFLVVSCMIMLNIMCKRLFSIMQSHSVVHFLFGTYAVITEGSIRLVGGSRVYEGRVEVYHSGVWGTVCDDIWDIRGANVVCRQLGYSGAAFLRYGSYFGRGSGQIYYFYLLCSGYEARVADCYYRADYCSHSEDAGVVCRASTRQGEC